MGRAQSDVATLIHVFRQDGYEFGLEGVRSVVDAGANVGYSAVWFAHRYPGATVIAVEPDEGNLALLRRNTSDLPQVHIVPAALMAFDGVANLIDPQEGPWAIRVQPHEEAWSDGVPMGSVPCVSVGTLLDQRGLQTLDLLKLDIEGSELDVLTDSDAWMPRVTSVVAELHDRFRPGCTAAFDLATATFSNRSERGENVFASRRP